MIKSPFENVNGVLYVDGVSTLELAKKYGTPLYVTSEKKIRENYRLLKDMFCEKYVKTKILYSAKANTNLSILKILKNEGAGIDAVSIGEIFLALKAGFMSHEILYTGVSVSKEEMEYALEKGVTINVDSLSQSQKIFKIATPERTSVRINPQIGAGHHEYTVTAGKVSKFGVDEETAIKIYKMAKENGVKRFGIHMHIGSGIMQVEPFLDSVEILLNIASKIHDKLGIDFEFVDIGGGIGVPYRPDEKEVDIEAFADKVTKLFKKRTLEKLIGEPELWLEPGRYIVAESTILLTRVNMVKETASRKFVGVDAGFNVLVRPTMYGSYHHVLLANRLNEPSTEKYDIVGPICETGDTLAKDRLLPKLQEDDILAILTTGAYGYSMSSQYNSRPRPAEVLVYEGKHELIRKREMFQDLLKGQRVASWLED